LPLELAKNCGFCYGVRRAMEIAHACGQKGVPVHTLGSLIHNPNVIEKLEQQGIRAVNTPEEAGEGILVIRSHGAGPDILEKAKALGLKVADATCPNVRRIQMEAEACWQQSRPIVIYGEKEHPEIQGILGWCRGQAYVVKDEPSVEGLPVLPGACILQQTTSSREKFEALLPAILKKTPGGQVFPSICRATEERQVEAAALSETSEAMIVIGGQTSANTAKLVELCRERCPKTYLIQQASELPLEELRSVPNIGITSGTSTPDWIIKEVLSLMSDIQNTAIPDPALEAVESAPETVPATSAEVPAPAPKAVKEEDREANFVTDFEKTMVTIHPGQVISGKVVSFNDTEVCVNIGYKSDGFIPVSEFELQEGQKPADVLHEGDEIEVEVVKVNDGDGNVLLSKKNIDVRRNWNEIMKAQEEGGRFEATGKQVVKGGLIATIKGIRTFIPASQLDTRYVEKIEKFIGETFPVKILEVDRSRRRIVASRKAAVSEDAATAKKAKWDRLTEGSQVKGIVRRLTDFGAFVDIGGIDGLVHVTNLAWGNVKHPKDVVSIGQTINCLILKVDKENQRVSLGYKQLLPKPWEVADEKYIPGSIVTGKVVRIVSFGAFVELEPGLDGLVHISQISEVRIDKVESVLTVGQIVHVKILDVNTQEHRISLSIRDANIPVTENDYSADDFEGYDEEDDSDLYEAGDIVGIDE